MNWKRVGLLLWVFFGALAFAESPAGGRPASTVGFRVKQYTTAQLPTCNVISNLGLIIWDTTVLRAKVCAGAAGWIPYGLPGSYVTASLPTCDASHNLGQVAWDSTVATAKVCQGPSGWIAQPTTSIQAAKVPIPTTGSTLAKWIFDGPDGAAIASDGDIIGNVTLQSWPAANSVGTQTVGIFNGAKVTTATTGMRTGGLTSGFFNAFAASAAWTLEIWFNPYGDFANGLAILSFNGLNYGTTDADSFLVQIQYDSTNKRPTLYRCVNHTTCTSTSLGSGNAPQNRWNFLAISKAAASGGNEVYTYWVNPTSATATGTLTAVQHTFTPVTPYLAIGGYADSGASSGNDLSGHGHVAVDELVIEQTAKSGATVYSDYINSRPAWVCNPIGYSCG